MTGASTEGWTWLWNARKWHYFVKGRSLCSRWMVLASDDLQAPDLPDRPEQCRACRRLLSKRLASRGQAGGKSQ